MIIVGHDHEHRRVSISLDYQAAQFIWLELPPDDGFTREWYEEVIVPIYRENEANEAAEEATWD